MQITDEGFFIAYLPIFQPTSTVGTTMSDFMDPTLGMVYAMSRIAQLIGSWGTRGHKKGALHVGRPCRTALPGHSVVIRECCLVSFIVAYTSSEQAIQAVTYQ